ncbi:hypothetical protein GCM10010306_060940 [Streptomyces umbrinus]|nr:hypothetical protein GCM10010306_060940 [Streptomyces umbrinus]
MVPARQKRAASPENAASRRLQRTLLPRGRTVNPAVEVAARRLLAGGGAQAGLRMVKGETLMREVSDGSGMSPHLRAGPG